MDILSIMNYLDKSFKAVCKAIKYFSQFEGNIFLPMKPTYAYDFIAVDLVVINCTEEKEFFTRVKVVQTESKSPSGSYVVNLRKSGGYSNSKEHKAPFDPLMCDVLFVISPESAYKIPSDKIKQKRAISLSMFEKFKCSDPS